MSPAGSKPGTPMPFDGVFDGAFDVDGGLMARCCCSLRDSHKCERLVVATGLTFACICALLLLHRRSARAPATRPSRHGRRGHAQYVEPLARPLAPRKPSSPTLWGCHDHEPAALDKPSECGYICGTCGYGGDPGSGRGLLNCSAMLR